MDFNVLPKALNIVLGIVTSVAILVAIDMYITPDKYQSGCTDIIRDGKVIGQACTFDHGPVLERVELTPDACFDFVRKSRGAEYAAQACYPEGYILEKRPL